MVSISESVIDHIIPISLAQNVKEIIELNSLSNLRLICKSCNQLKGTLLKFDQAILPDFAQFYIERAQREE